MKDYQTLLDILVRDLTSITRPISKSEVRARIKEVVVEVIGEDEDVEHRFMQPIDNIALGRNNLRADLRAKLTGLDEK